MTMPIEYQRNWVCTKCEGTQHTKRYVSVTNLLTINCSQCGYWTNMQPRDRYTDTGGPHDTVS